MDNKRKQCLLIDVSTHDPDGAVFVDEVVDGGAVPSEGGVELLYHVPSSQKLAETVYYAS